MEKNEKHEEFSHDSEIFVKALEEARDESRWLLEVLIQKRRAERQGRDANFKAKLSSTLHLLPPEEKQRAELIFATLALADTVITLQEDVVLCDASELCLDNVRLIRREILAFREKLEMLLADNPLIRNGEAEGGGDDAGNS